MKIVGIGDLLIPEQYIKEGFKELEKKGHQVETIQWKLKDYEELQNINLKVETEGCESVEPSDEVIEAVKDAEVIITQFCPITKKLIDACPSLKVIGVLRGGYENINVEYAEEKGILLYHTPGRNSNAVADFTVGMLLAECRNIAKSHCNLKKGFWVRDYTNAASVPDLPYKTVGIVGFGEIGRKVAQRLKGFEMKILTFDPYVKEVPDYVTKVDSLESLAEQSETEHIINENILNHMKETAYLINTARSGLVDEKALYQALKDKKIIGAALDVFDVEPPTADYPLITLENVTVTPHLAGGTVDAFTNSPRLLAQEMLGLVDGKESRYIINPERLKEVAEKLS